MGGMDASTVEKLRNAAQDWWDVVVALVGGAMSAYSILEQLIKFGVIKSNSIWPTGILIFLVFGSIAMVRARWEANRYKREKPILRVADYGEEPKTLYPQGIWIGGLEDQKPKEEKYRTLFIEVFNKQEHSIAKRVWASIEWMNQRGKVLLTHQGRWHIASPNTAEKKEELQFVDFDSNRHSRRLHFASINIARNDRFYGLGREMDGKESWDNAEYELDRKQYVVRITLRGNNGVKQEFKYSIRNRNGSLSIVKALTSESRKESIE